MINKEIDIEKIQKKYEQFKEMSECAFKEGDEGHALACQEIADKYNAMLKQKKEH